MVGAGLGREQHLGADAVGGGDQHGIGEAAGGEVEQPAEAAQRRIGARRARSPWRPGAMRVDQIGAGIDVDAGLGVAAAAGCCLSPHARIAR